MNHVQAKKKLTIAINAMEAAGYDPYAQLTGYMVTGNTAYITRQGGARKIVCELGRSVIEHCLADKGRSCLQ